MTRFAAPIAEQIWDMKYRFKEADGTPLDGTVEDTWRRIARALAVVEKDADHWENEFYGALGWLGSVQDQAQLRSGECRPCR